MLLHSEMLSDLFRYVFGPSRASRGVLSDLFGKLLDISGRVLSDLFGRPSDLSPSVVIQQYYTLLYCIRSLDERCLEVLPDMFGTAFGLIREALRPILEVSGPIWEMFPDLFGTL